MWLLQRLFFYSKTGYAQAVITGKTWGREGAEQMCRKKRIIVDCEKLYICASIQMPRNIYVSESVCGVLNGNGKSRINVIRSPVR